MYVYIYMNIEIGGTNAAFLFPEFLVSSSQCFSKNHAKGIFEPKPRLIYSANQWLSIKIFGDYNPWN